jgi:hypothetical protein
MSRLDMDGPFDFTVASIADIVREPLPGTFAIGHVDKYKRFAVQYVGRDDTNVQQALVQALQSGIGKPGMMKALFGGEKKATAFKFSYSADAKAAFSKHCRSYHAFNGSGQLKNDGHPEAPEGSDLNCPHCDYRG